jgi:hypothetical protein
MIPWHELFGFVVLWILGYACYQMGRCFEEDKWVRHLIGFAEELDRLNAEHHDDLERLPR